MKIFLAAMMGLVVLSIIVVVTPVAQQTIKDIEGLADGAWVGCSGTVEQVWIDEGRTSILMQDATGKVIVIIFSALDIERYDKIRVIGHKEVWKGKVQVIADEIVRT
ncbi:MAG: hypothetical protein Q7R96_02250 [Nanoarchaeota archaeon]|nr:hypothetical protein [Nanoarchaeota archaeon]